MITPRIISWESGGGPEIWLTHARRFDKFIFIVFRMSVWYSESVVVAPW